MIDSHMHLWSIGAHGCEWPGPDLPEIHCDFGLEDAHRVAKPAGIEGVVLVQSQTCDEDTDFLLRLAAQDDFVRGVVGWADLLAPSAPARIAALAAQEKLVGLRPMLQGLPDGWIANPALDPAIEAMIEHDLAFDALVFTRHLRDLRDFAERHPGLRIVIDHGAKPPIASGEIEDWRKEMGAIAELPQIHCKLSGLLTEAGERRSDQALLPYVTHLIESFGPDRLMWGGDWPVLTLACGYSTWLGQARAMVERLASDDADMIFGTVAQRFYGWSDRS
jgi:L-fuconolactonase